MNFFSRTARERSMCGESRWRVSGALTGTRTWLEVSYEVPAVTRNLYFFACGVVAASLGGVDEVEDCPADDIMGQQ